MRVAVSIMLTGDERATLQRWARGRSVEARRVLRAKIVLAAATGRQNKEIADELVISLSTVKRHVANAYGKLGASHRTEAVARANALDLL